MAAYLPSPASDILLKAASVCAAFHAAGKPAARDLGVSPTVLSQRIAAGESKTGVRLFNRTTRSVAPTLAGSQFVAEIEPALDAVTHAVDTINAHRARPAGRLRINSSVGAAKRILTSLIIAFSREYPEIEIDLVTEDRPIDIVAEGFDAGIRTGYTVPRDMIALRLEPDQTSSVVGTPGYLANKPVPRIPKDLLQHRCIRSRMPSGDIDPWEFVVEGKIQRIQVPDVLTRAAGRMMERSRGEKLPRETCDVVGFSADNALPVCGWRGVAA